MKTDTIFYRLFQSFPSIFFELINQPTETANTYQFSSVEVKQLAFRIDGVFIPKGNAASLPIYFLEVQFQPDKKIYSRFLAETLEGKLEAIPFMLSLGANVEQIAEALNLDIELVRLVAKNG